MDRKKLLPYMAYLGIFSLLILTEQKMGIAAFAVPFLMALVFCRQNIPVVCLMYAGVSMAFTPTVINLVFAFSPAIVVIIGSFLHYRLKKRLSLVTLSIYTLLSLTPHIVFTSSDIYQIVNTVVSIVGAEILTYVMVSVAYPVLVRGSGYRLKHAEAIACFITVSILFMGISFLDIMGISLFFGFAAFAVLITLAVSPSHAVPISAAIGLGGAVAQFSPIFIALCVGIGLVSSAFKDLHFAYAAVAAFLAYFTLSIVFSVGIGWHLAAVGGGCLLSCFVPRKWLFSVLSSSVETFATRTVLNRDRQEISSRLGDLSNVFYEMQDILRLDLGEKKKQYDKATVAKEIVGRCCSQCPYKKLCTEQFGSGTYVADHVAACAMEGGRVMLLDLPSGLTNGCKRISALMATANEVMTRLKRRQEINTSIEQGREMIIDQMGGVGMLLSKLGGDMKSRLSYDTALEQKLIRELLNINVNASEAIVYGIDKRVDRVIITIKEGEAGNKNLRTVVSNVMSRRMVETKRERNTNGRASLHFVPAPKYEVLYGEKAVSGDGVFCGDNREAVRLDENRLMLILSDGMGTGEKAYRSSLNAIRMIESFYRAGFDHETVLSCVGRLLCLREQEDFNALDIAILDIKSGAIDFIKQGGRESFVLSNGLVDVIDCGSLPLGIVSESVPLIEQRKASEGDVLILCSDGVIDVLTVDGIKDILLNVNAVNPQLLADIIIDNAVKMSNITEKKDDMSCLVARIVTAAIN